MTLKEAVKSGRPFRRKTDSSVYYYIYKMNSNLTIENAIADDWEIEPMLKRKVTKTVRGWVNVYTEPCKFNDIFPAKDIADYYATLAGCPKRTACVEMTGTYEVFEEDSNDQTTTRA